MQKAKLLPVEAKNKFCEFSYLESLGVALIEYTVLNPEFGEELRKLCSQIRYGYQGRELRESLYSSWLLPANLEVALQRTVWLINQINEDKVLGARDTAERLLEWERNYPHKSPKQLIVGLAATSIPGLTLGKVSKLTNMALIVNKESSFKAGTELARLVVRASQGIVSKSLDKARGSVDSLEPEVAMWMYGDREVDFHQAEGEQIRKIKFELDKAGAVSEIIRKDNKPQALALSPVVNVSAVKESWNLESLKN